MLLLEEYSDQLYDLKGNWDNESGNIRMWFPISPFKPEALPAPFHTRRSILLREMSRFTLSPKAQLMPSDDIHTTNPDIALPEEETMDTDISTELVVVEARFLSQMGNNALRLSAGIAVDTFSDQMLEIPQN